MICPMPHDEVEISNSNQHYSGTEYPTAIAYKYSCQQYRKVEHVLKLAD